jgi:AraC-like DNA-binding protein
VYVIVNAGQERADIRVDGVVMHLLPGERLLHAGIPLPRVPGLSIVPLPGSGMARALAHFHHVCGAPPVLPEPLPLHWVVQAELEVPELAAGWLINQLSRDRSQVRDSQLSRLLGHLARTESYGLMQFLLEQGADLSVAELAERYGLSSAQFHRRCRQMLGRPLKRELRIMRAARALLDYPGRTRSFTYLAADHGYASLSHFCTDIKSLIGCSPLSVYRAVTTPIE